MERKKLLILAALTAAVGLTVWSSSAMAASGPHSDKGCAMCHAPHNSVLSTGGAVIIPLWNPKSQKASWDGVTTDPVTGDHVLTFADEQHTATILTGSTYTSSTMDATEKGLAITTPTASGASVLCLSCHDGTHSSSSHKFVDTAGSGMGTLSASHPIGITYSTAAAVDTELKPVADLEVGVLDGLGKVGCPSCHDVHSSADTTFGYSKYLRWAYKDDSHRVGSTSFGAVRSSDFCRHCHAK